MKKAFIGIIIFALLAVIGVLAFRHFRSGRVTLPPQYYHSTASPTPSAVKPLDHIVIIMEENKPQGSIIGSSNAPYINSLATKYARANHYYAVTNPSLPNYIALTSGTTAGIHNDCNPPSSSCQAAVSNIADRLEQAHKSWKAYLEDMPQACYPNNSGNYAVKHNPFVYYPDILHNSSRCKAHVVPLHELSDDLSSPNGLPDYVFITPNLCNDMHNCSVKTGDSWLAAHVPALLASPAFTKQHSLLVIAWDEGTDTNNNTPILFVGPAAKRSYISTTYYSHYSLLHTIENNWHLPPLTQNDASAPLMTDMLQ